MPIRLEKKMSNKRRSYSPTEKAKIALEAIRGDLTLAQISSKYSVHSTQVNKWKKQVVMQLPEAFLNKAKHLQADHEVELKTLYEQIGRLKIENEFLKKKCDLFA